jgi:hypothetical protein
MVGAPKVEAHNQEEGVRQFWTGNLGNRAIDDGGRNDYSNQGLRKFPCEIDIPLIAAMPVLF